MSENEDLEGIERRLLSADFSAESRVRASLRARLLRRAGAGRGPLRSAARAAVFAAVVVAVLAPLLRLTRRGAALGGPESAAAYPRGPEGLPVLPGTFARAAAPDAPLFRTAVGREVADEGGKAVVWELDGAVFRLETRRTSADEIFETPHWRGVL